LAGRLVGEVKPNRALDLFWFATRVQMYLQHEISVLLEWP